VRSRHLAWPRWRRAATFPVSRPVPARHCDLTTPPAGVLPVTATQGRWQDTTPIVLDNATLRMQGNAAVDVEPNGGSHHRQGRCLRRSRSRCYRPRSPSAPWRAPSITRAGNGSLTFNADAGDALGGDERLIVTGTAPGRVARRRMVAPWIDQQHQHRVHHRQRPDRLLQGGLRRGVQTGGAAAATLNLGR